MSLEDYGDLKGNCLGSQPHRCAEGRDQFFAAHDQQGELLAAVQLHNYGTGRQPVQVEGPQHSRAPSQVKKAAEELAVRYNQASQRKTLRETERAN